MTDAVRQAIADFRDDLARARADLEATVWGIIGTGRDGLLVDGDGDPDDILVDGHDSVSLLDRGALVDLLAHLADAPEKTAAAFANFDWTTSRALKTLQQALARETAGG
jgi:hypothetical protein